MAKTVGSLGEDLGVVYLKNKGHRIVARNYRCSVGEVDIVSFYQGVYYFNEVKSAYKGQFNPLERITASKINKLIKVSRWYMKENQIQDTDWSISGLGVIMAKGKKTEYFYEENITL